MKSTEAIDALIALGQEHRLAMFRRLVRAGQSGLPASDIAADSNIAPATASFHLKLLKQAGLVRAQRQGRSIIYSARFDSISALIQYLMTNCCADDAKQCQPQALLKTPSQPSPSTNSKPIEEP